MNDCEKAQVSTWANEVGGLCPYPTMTPMTDAENREKIRIARVQQAVYVLKQAAEIRADAALMAEIRQYVRQERDLLLTFLDQIGERS